MNYNHQKYGRPTWKRLAKAVGELDYRLFKVREGLGMGGYIVHLFLEQSPFSSLPLSSVSLLLPPSVPAQRLPGKSEMQF